MWRRVRIRLTAPLKGKGLATRKILQMIEKRERAIAARRPQPKRQSVQVLSTYDSNSADDAMFILGITAERPDLDKPVEPFNTRQLQTWVVEAALKRRGRPQLVERNVDDIRRCTVGGRDLAIAADRAR